MNKACMKLPSAVWTITYVIHEDETVTIHNFDSQDNDGYMFAATLPELTALVEDSDRVVQSITIGDKTYNVRNKQNVFMYKQPL